MPIPRFARDAKLYRAFIARDFEFAFRHERLGLGLRIRLSDAHASRVGEAGERSVRFQPKFEVEIQRMQKIHETDSWRRMLFCGRRFERVPGIDEQVADARLDVANLWWSEHAFPAADGISFSLLAVAAKRRI